MLANLRALFGVIVDIVLLRRGAESLPASSMLLVIVVVLEAAVASLMWSISANAPDGWPLQLLVSIIVSLLIFKLAFVLAKKRERFLQTMTAIFGTSALFAPALIPTLGVLLPYLQKMDRASPPPTALLILGAGLAIWELVVQVRIVRGAFEWPWGFAIIFIFAQEFAGALVYSTLFLVPQAAG